MRRVVPVLVVMFALLAFAPAVAADTTPPGSTPRESFESIGFDAFSSECDERTCTDTFMFTEQQTTSSGETFSYVCADQFTYSIRTGRGTGIGGCAESVDLTVAGDLSSASLAPTAIEMCSRRCETVTVSADIQGTGETSTFRSRFTERDGTCTFTYSDSGERQLATGTITFGGVTRVADGSIHSVKTAFSSKCR